MGIMDVGVSTRNLALQSFRNLADIEKSRQSYELRHQAEKDQLDAAQDARKSQNMGNLASLGGMAGYKYGPKLAGMLGSGSGVPEKVAEAGLSKSAGAFLEGGKAGAAGLEAGLKSTAAANLANAGGSGLLSGGTTAALSAAAPAAAEGLAPAGVLGATSIGGPAAATFGTGFASMTGAGATAAGTAIGSGAAGAGALGSGAAGAGATGAGAASGALAGSAVPIIGTAIGAGLGLLFGSLF